MNKTLNQEFLEIIHSFGKLRNKFHPNVKAHPGELMMLGTIHKCLSYNKEQHSDAPGVKVGELSDMIHSTKSATSKMLKAIEEKGFIERVADSKDRRIVYIRLSDSGEEIVKEAHCKMGDLTERTIQKLGEEDLNDLIRLLKKLYQAMSEELDEKKEE